MLLKNLEQIIRQMPGYVYSYTSDGDYLASSKELLKLIGINPTDNKNVKRHGDIVKKCITTNVSNAGAHGELYINKIKETDLIKQNIVTLDARKYFFDSADSPVCDDEGNNIATVTVIYNLIQDTRDDNIESSLVDTNPDIYLKSIIANLPGTVSWKDLDGRILGCNQFTADIAGLKNPDELVGKTDHELMNWEKQADIYRKNDLKVMKSGKKMFLEEPVTLADGRLATFQGVKAPLKDDSGNVIGVIVLGVDVTERKKLEEDLKIYKAQAEAYLENAAEHMPGLIYWKDLDGKFIGCNSAFARDAGVKTPNDIVGKTVYDMPWKERAEEISQLESDIIASGKSIEIEEDFIQPDGSRTVYLTEKSPLFDQQRDIIGTISVSFDITERKEIEEEKLATMKSLGASIAHELRTPLASIRGSVQALEDYMPIFWDAYEQADKADLPIDFISNRQLDAIKKSLSRMDGETNSAFLIIDMLLKAVDISEIKKEKFTTCSIKQCIDSALERYHYPIGGRQSIHWDGKQDFQFIGDSVLTQHVLFNLLKNAFYYLGDKEKNYISIWCDSDKRFNILHFKDTGAGIAEDVLPHIFERFYTETPHGTGVGLTFCKNIMEACGGYIFCESTPGEHTEFIMKFPKLDMTKTS